MVRMIAGRLITESTEEEPGTIVVNPTVSWNPSASPVQVTIQNWNRDFAEGTLEAWTYVDALISREDPYEGDFCVELTETDAYIFQTLDEPVPVYAVYEFSVWLRRPNGVAAHFTLRMHHTDDTTNDVSGSLTEDGWHRFYFERSMMDTAKILSAVSVRSYEGRLFADKIFLGIATEVIAGSVESLQTIPRSLQAEVIARPKGYEMTGFPKTGSVATSATEWRTVTGAQYTPEDNYKFMLTKILVSCPSDVLYRLCWGTPVDPRTVISAAQIFVTGGIPFTDWFPWGYHRFWSDGERTFEIQVRAPTADDEDTCYAEIVGEHVETIFNL